MTSKSPTTTNVRRSGTTIDPVHPGDVLREEFLVPLAMSARSLAARIGVPANRVSEIAAGRRSVTGDTALRFSKAFGTTPEFWLNLQKAWELDVARDGFDAEIEPVA